MCISTRYLLVARSFTGLCVSNPFGYREIPSSIERSKTEELVRMERGNGIGTTIIKSLDPAYEVIVIS